MGNLGFEIFWSKYMIYKVDDYVNEYVKLCSQLCKKEEDYTKENILLHNKAMKRLIKLKEKMYLDSQITSDVYDKLLCSNDPYIKQDAATECLSLRIHTDASLAILKEIVRSGERMSAMSAKRTLLIWEGKLDPDSPF